MLNPYVVGRVLLVTFFSINGYLNVVNPSPFVVKKYFDVHV